MTAAIELSIQRRATEDFIAANSSMITLKHHNFIMSGGTKVDGGFTVKDPQELRIIWDGSDGINRQVNEEQSGSRRFDFILVGKYDADAEDVFKRADKALYRAKQAGRNQIHFAN